MSQLISQILRLSHWYHDRMLIDKWGGGPKWSARGEASCVTRAIMESPDFEECCTELVFIQIYETILVAG